MSVGYKKVASHRPRPGGNVRFSFLSFLFFFFFIDVKLTITMNNNDGNKSTSYPFCGLFLLVLR